MMYNELVESYFFAPKHVGTLDVAQALTVCYRGGEVGRGDRVDFYLHCDNKGLILKACFKASGNPYLIAAAECFCRQLEGSLIEKHPNFNYAWLVQELAIPKTRYSVALQIEDWYRDLVLMMKAKLEGEKE